MQFITRTGITIETIPLSEILFATGKQLNFASKNIDRKENFQFTKEFLIYKSYALLAKEDK